MAVLVHGSRSQQLERTHKTGTHSAIAPINKHDCPQSFSRAHLATHVVSQRAKRTTTANEWRFQRWAEIRVTSRKVTDVNQKTVVQRHHAFSVLLFPHVFVSLPPQIAVRFKRGVMSEELFAQKGVILSGVPQKQERESTFCRPP